MGLAFPSFPRSKIGVVLALAAAPMMACGPSVQLIYEGNIRFEHCYRLDFDEQIAPSHRRACWAEWVSSYAQGQTRDRIDYANRRVDALNHGDGAALRLDLGTSADAGVLAAVADPVPVPTNVHAPPPAVQAPAPSSAASAEVPSAGTAHPPAQEPSAAADPGTSSPTSAKASTLAAGKPRPGKRDPRKPIRAKQ